MLNATRFRNIGPFRTSAWVTEIAVPDTPARDHLYTIYAATRTGGLWKTTNNGITWDPISDSIEVAAVGAVALAPSKPEIVWMGTGDQANARSSYSGKGVYKSIDAGKTWQLMGLPDSHHIARIVIHPTNPDIVYVAAMGHLFSRNEERGVFRTRNGGRRGRRCCMSTTAPARSISSSTASRRTRCTRRCTEAPNAVATRARRTRQRHLPHGRRRRQVAKARGAADRQRRADRPRHQQRNPNVLTAIVENLNARKEGMPARIDACQASGARGGGGGGGRAGRAADRWATRCIAARMAGGPGRSCTATTSTSQGRRRPIRSTRSRLIRRIHRRSS